MKNAVCMMVHCSYQVLKKDNKIQVNKISQQVDDVLKGDTGDMGDDTDQDDKEEATSKITVTRCQNGGK